MVRYQATLSAVGHILSWLVVSNDITGRMSNVYSAGKWLACQSMDNQIVVFNALNHFKFMRKKVFKGHMVAGYACGLDFSPEMRCCIVYTV